MSDVFISYSRKNNTFARRLTDGLRQAGKDSWVDWEGIPLSSPNWWQEITNGIDKTDNFVFIMSPDSMASVVCNMELDYALDLNKRVIIVAYEDVIVTDAFATIEEYIPDNAMQTRLGDDTPISKARDNWTRINHINWLFFRDEDDFDVAFNQLINTVETDLDYVKSHTRYLSRAREWEDNAERPDLLLYGDEIDFAENWLQRGNLYTRQAETRNDDKKMDVINPLPDDLHRKYITASREAEQGRKRIQRITRVSIAALLFALVAAGIISAYIVDDTQSRAANIQATSDAGIALADQQIAAANTQIIQAENQVESANSELTAIPPTLTEVNNAIVSAQQEAESAETQVALAEIEVTNASVSIATNQAQLSANEAEIAANQAIIDGFGATLTPLAQDADDARALADTAGTEAAIAGTQVADAQVEVTSAAIAIGTNEAQIAANEAEIAANQELIDGFGATLTPLAQDASDARALADTAGTEAAFAGTEVAFAETQVADAQVEVTSAAIAIGTNEAQIAANQAIIDGFGATLTPLADEVNDARALADTAETEAAIAGTEVSNADVAVALAETQQAFAEEQIISAEAQITEVAVTLVAIRTESAEAEAQARAISLAVEAEQSVGNANYDQALVLALESLQTDPGLTQAQRVLNQLAYTTARFSFINTPGAHILGDRVVVGEENAAVIYDLINRTELQRLTGFNDRVNAIAISPDDTLIAVAGEDGQVRVWDAVSGTERFNLGSDGNGHTVAVNAIAFSPDATWLVSGGDDNRNLIWNMSDGSLQRELSLANDRQITRLYAYNINNFVSWEQSNADTVMVMWNRNNNNPIFSSGEVSFETFTENGRYALDTDGNVWTPGDDNALRNYAVEMNGQITASAFSGNSTVITVSPLSGFTSQLTLFNDLSPQASQNISLSSNDVIRAAAVSPDGLTLALGDGRFIILYDLLNQRELRRLGAHNDTIEDLYFSVDGRFLTSRSTDGNFRIWDVQGRDPAEIRRITPRTEVNPVNHPGISPDETLVYAGVFNSLFSWRPEQDERIASVAIGNQVQGVFHNPVAPQSIVVEPSRLSVWDMTTGNRINYLNISGSYNEHSAIAISPDGQLIAVEGNELALYELETQRQIMAYSTRDLIDNSDSILTMAISANNRYLLASVGHPSDRNRQARDVIVWDAISGELVTRFGADQHRRQITHIAASPFEQVALTASFDGTLVLWDIRTGELVARLAGHNGPVNVVEFAADGNSAVSGAEDGELIQWDLQTAQPLRRFLGHQQPVTSLAVRNRLIASSTGENTMIVWEIQPIAELKQWVESNRHVARLSCEEADQFGIRSDNCQREAVNFAQPCDVVATTDGVGVFVAPDTGRNQRQLLPQNIPVRVRAQVTNEQGQWWLISLLGWEREPDRFWTQAALVESSGDCESVPVFTTE